MKKVSSITVGALAGVLLFGAVASATDTGSITNTGPGSTNTITMSDRCSLDVTNTTTVDVTNNNPRSAGSGDATNDGNTSGGNAQSGSAGNTSTTNVGVNVTNGPVTDCNVSQPTNPGNGGGEVNAPTGGGRGAGQVSGAQVQAPVGGVGAGGGGLVTSIFTASILSGGLGLYRVKKSAFDKA